MKTSNMDPDYIGDLARLVSDLEDVLVPTSSASGDAVRDALACAVANEEDPLLDTLRRAAHQRDIAEATIRRVVYYARHVAPTTYRLAELAEASGMSISGVRTVPTPADAQSVEEALQDGDPLHLDEAEILSAITKELERGDLRAPGLSEPRGNMGVG